MIKRRTAVKDYKSDYCEEETVDGEGEEERYSVPKQASRKGCRA